MNVKDLEKQCLKPGVTKEFPFGNEAMVFKVSGKMFALIAHLKSPLRITLKATPEDVIGLVNAYENISHGYYMNKKHWITILLDNFEAKLLQTLIDDSYKLVYNKLTKKEKEQIAL